MSHELYNAEPEYPWQDEMAEAEHYEGMSAYYYQVRYCERVRESYPQAGSREWQWAVNWLKENGDKFSSKGRK